MASELEVGGIKATTAADTNVRLTVSNTSGVRDTSLEFADGLGVESEINYSSYYKRLDINNKEAGEVRVLTSDTPRLTIDSGGAVSVPDNGELQCGDSSDLRLYHNATNSYIKNVTGSLYLGGDADILFTDSAFSTAKVTFASSGLATFSGGIAVSGAATDAHSSIQNVNSLAMAHTTTTTFECPSGLFAIYDTGGYGALFFSEHSLATPTKVAGAAHFGVATGAIQITSATNDSTVTINNQQGGTRTISIMVLGN